MTYLSFSCFLVALAGAALLIASLTYRGARALRARKIGFVPAAAPFLLGSGVILRGALALLGATGDLIVYKNHGVTPLTLFTAINQTSIDGTIELTGYWAQLNLAPGQTRDGKPLQGFVVLLKDPAAPNPSDFDRQRAAYKHFSPLDGAHCSLTGEWRPNSTLRYFKVESEKC